MYSVDHLGSEKNSGGLRTLYIVSQGTDEVCLYAATRLRGAIELVRIGNFPVKFKFILIVIGRNAGFT